MPRPPSSSPLESLSIRELSRLVIERHRSRLKLPNLTGIDPRKFRERSNIGIYLSKAEGFNDESVKQFEKACRFLSINAKDLLETLYEFGLKDQDLKEAWGIVESISNKVRDLVDLCTNLETQKDFGKKLVDFGQSLANFLKQDIILDEKIDKLERSR